MNLFVILIMLLYSFRVVFFFMINPPVKYMSPMLVLLYTRKTPTTSLYNTYGNQNHVNIPLVNIKLPFPALHASCIPPSLLGL